jgi:hypothetical protein
MDHFPEGASGTCPLCSKSFASTKLKNRHIKRVHQTVMENCRKSHIICPLCEERNEVKTQENLRKHLEEKHEVSIENLSLQFSSSQQYEMWKNIKEIETNYAKNRGLNNNGHKEIHYECKEATLKVKIKKNNLHDYEVFFKDLKARPARGRGSLVGL